MTTLITGGTGFIGAPTVQKVLARGESVVSFDSDPNIDALAQVVGAENVREIPVIRGDVRDLAHLGRVIREHKVDRIIHLAYLLVPACQENPMLAVDVNCTGTLNIFESSRIHDLTKVVWASSMAVFGYLSAERQDGEVLTESSPLTPDHVYGSCKALNEYLALDYQKWGVDALGLRLNLVYGRGKMRGQGMFTQELIDRPVAEGVGVVPYGDDSFDWQYVDDVARAFELAAFAEPAPLPVMNLYCGSRSTVEAVDVMRGLLPDAKITTTPGRIGFPYRVDGDAFAEHTGFAPEHSLEQGLTKIVQGLKETAN